MSEAWSQLRDIDRLADGRIDLDFVIPLTSLPRLSSYPIGTDDSVRGTAKFRRERGLAVAELTVTGQVPLVCQRCLQPMRLAVDGLTSIALVVNESEAERVPAEFEPVRAPEGRIRVRDLVEEEVLLALPIVALHGSDEHCVPQEAAGSLQSVSAGEETRQRPFEQLGELLKR